MSIGGSSGKSSGMAFLYRNSNQERADAYIKEEKVSLSEFMHPKLIPAQNAFMGCASAKLAVKTSYFLMMTIESEYPWCCYSNAQVAFHMSVLIRGNFACAGSCRETWHNGRSQRYSAQTQPS